MFYYFVRPRKDSKYWNRKPLTPGVHWMSFFLHPGKTWNLNITGVKRKITFQSSLLGSMLISGVSRGQLRHGQRWKIRQSMICGFFQPALSLSFKALAWVLNSPTFETLWHKHSESRSSSKKNTSFTAAFTSSPKSWLQKVFSAVFKRGTQLHVSIPSCIYPLQNAIYKMHCLGVFGSAH